MDAKLRITADGAQASKTLRDIAKEGKAARDAVAPAPSGLAPFADVSAGAAEATKQVRRTREEIAAAATQRKAEAAEAKRQAAEQRAAERAAAQAAAEEAKRKAAEARKLAAEQKAIADAAAKAQRQAANQARQLAPQLTDIAVGLSTGQSPFTVLLQQGGQLKDVFGGVGNALKALLSIFTVGRVLIGGATAAIGGFVYLLNQGREQSEALTRSVGLVGNVAAVTAGRFEDMAHRISTSQNAAIGDVEATLAALVASGEFTAVSLESAGRAAATLQKVTGQTSEETIKQFAGMGDGVAAWAEKANRAYNFLSAAQYRQIQALEAQRKPQEAMKLALDALNATLEQRAVPALGYVERAWNGVKAAISGALQAVRDWGKETTVEDKLASIRKEIELLEASRGSRGGRRTSTIDARVAELRDQEAAEQELQRIKAKAADAEAKRNADAQEGIKKESKAYQDAQTQIALAGVQQRLAATLAGLDREQSAAEIAHARELTSQAEFTLALDAIERRRAEAQLAAIERQRSIEAGRKVTTPEDTAARDASVKQLEAQITGAQAKVSAALAKINVDTIENSRALIEQWSQLWQQAYAKTRDLAAENAAAAAARIADPVARAAEEARLSVAQLEGELVGLKRALLLQIDLEIDPTKAAALQRQLDDLSTKGGAAIAERTRAATLGSLQASFGELDQKLQLQEQALATAVEQGALTTEEAERRKFAARAASLPQLEKILAAIQALAQTDAEKNAVGALILNLQQLRGEATELEKAFRGSATSSLTDALDAMSTKSKTAKDALLDMVGSFAKSMAHVLNQRLAERLVGQFESAIGSNGGGFLGFLAGLIGGGSGGGASASYGGDVGLSYGHTGAIIGGAGGWSQRAPASAAAAVYAYAPRFHSGGILGLKPNEVPFVGEVGEEVLTRDDPRHSRNLAGGLQVTNHVSISGADGTSADQRAAGDDLVRVINGAITDWAATQSRQGGLLAKR